MDVRVGREAKMSLVESQECAHDEKQMMEAPDCSGRFAVRREVGCGGLEAGRRMLEVAVTGCRACCDRCKTVIKVATTSKMKR